jgi:hypothetical protein
MRKTIASLILLLLLPGVGNAEEGGKRVRKIHLKRDDIALVHTAVGIATLIQVPDRPTSVVLGDTNAFKIEYLESAITLKPLSHASKSNLYIYTEARRFNVTLETGQNASADYVVYLDSESKIETPPKEPQEHWRLVHIEKSSHDLTLTIHRLGTVGDLLMVDFSLSATKAFSFQPGWIWLTQTGKTVPIQSLSLSGVNLSPQTAIQGLITLRRSDIPLAHSLSLDVRGKNAFSVRLPEVRRWMK